MKAAVRVGAGAGFQGDRLEPAVILATQGALDTGVTTSLALDPHGESLSYALLELPIDD